MVKAHWTAQKTQSNSHPYKEKRSEKKGKKIKGGEGIKTGVKKESNQANEPINENE